MRVFQIADENFMRREPNISKYLSRVRDAALSAGFTYQLLDWHDYLSNPDFKSIYEILSDKCSDDPSKVLPLFCDYIRYVELSEEPSIYIDADIQLIDNNFFGELKKIFNHNNGQLWLGGEPKGLVVLPCNGFMISTEHHLNKRSLQLIIDKFLAIINDNDSQLDEIWGNRIFEDLDIKYQLIDSSILFPSTYKGRNLDNLTSRVMACHHYGYPKPDPEEFLNHIKSINLSTSCL